MSNLLLVTTDDALAARVRGTTAELGLEVETREPPRPDESGSTYAKQLIEEEPLIVVLHLGDDPQSLFEVASEIDRLRGDIGLVYITPPTSAAMRHALRAGVRDLLPPDARPAEIADALSRVQEVAIRRRGERAAGDETPLARTIAVVSPKGGVGKTMLATNLAVGLAHAHPREVCIVDLDLQFGDVANTLRIVPDNTIAHAVSSGLHDATALKLDLASHPSGIFALCAPEDPGDADAIRPEHIAQVIELLSASFNYVVLDTDPGLGEQTLAAIEQATDLIFVCATDVASVRGLNKELTALDRLGLTGAQRHFVLNRSDANVGLSVEAISDTVALDVDVFVPSSRAVPLAMNQGTSLLEGESSAVTKPLWQLVRRFTKASLPIDEPSKSTSFFKRS